MPISRAQMNKEISTGGIKKYRSGGLVSYNGQPLKPGERTGNIAVSYTHLTLPTILLV